MKTNLLLVGLMALTMLLPVGGYACGEGDEETAPAAQPTNCDELANRLAGAKAGDVITVAPGRYSCSNTIPEGVTVQGNPDGEKPQFISDGPPAFRFDAESGQVAIKHLAITASGVAILGTGAGNADIEDVEVISQTGVAILLEKPSSAKLSGVKLTGPWTGNLDEADGLEDGEYDGQKTAIAALIISQIKTASLENVEISGYSGFGAIIFKSEGSWKGGLVTHTSGSSVLIEESPSFSIENVTISYCRQDTDVGQGQNNPVNPYAMVISGNSTVTTRGLKIEKTNGRGIIQDQSRSSHFGLYISEAKNAAIWVQNSTGAANSPALQLSGQSKITGNRGAAVVMLNSAVLSISDTELAETGEIYVEDGSETGQQPAGDGLQLVGVTGQVVLSNVKLTNNERVGILIDGGGGESAPVSAPTFTVAGLSIDNDEFPDAYGLIGQNGMTRGAVLSGAVDTYVNPTLETKDVQFEDAHMSIETISPTATFPSLGLTGQNGFVGPEGIVSGETGLIGQNGVVGPEGFTKLIGQNG